MTNREKSLLRHLVNQGYSNKEIKEEIDCCDAIIRRYRKIFGKNPYHRKGIGYNIKTKELKYL